MATRTQQPNANDHLKVDNVKASTKPACLTPKTSLIDKKREPHASDNGIIENQVAEVHNHDQNKLLLSPSNGKET